MRAWIFVALGIAACAAPKVVGPRRPAIVDVRASAPSALPIEPERPTCAVLAHEQKLAIESALTELGNVSARDENARSSALEVARGGLETLGRFCFEDETSIWMLRADGASTEPPLDPMTPVRFDWRLVHVDRTGKRVSIQHPLVADDGQPLTVSDMIFVELDPPVLFDFDGDGELEVFLRVRGHYHESKSWSASRVFTFENGQVSEYGPAKGIAIEEMRDVDGDGRPDLLGYGAFDTILSGCCSGFDHRVTGPLLVVHTLPDGTFARDDEVTRRERASACAAHAGPIARKQTSWNEVEIAMRIACARLAGTSGRVIVKALDDAKGKKDQCDLETCTDREEVRRELGSWAR